MRSLSDPRNPVSHSPLSDVGRQVLNRVGGRRCAPADLFRELARDLNLHRERAQVIVRELVAAGELAYICEHGRTFLEPSFDRAVRVSERIVLAPPERCVQPGPADVVIRIMPGAAFGAGRHPTTRLALKAIDFVLGRNGASLAGRGRGVLDIGAGSGVLAMAAVMLGIETGLAVDIDPCAVVEARANVELNGLSRRIEVSDQAADTIDGSYDLVTANLRTPTLVCLARFLYTRITSQGALVLSGIRTEECRELLREFEKHYFNPVWRDEEQEWVGVALAKRR